MKKVKNLKIYFWLVRVENKLLLSGSFYWYDLFCTDIHIYWLEFEVYA